MDPVKLQQMISGCTQGTDDAKAQFFSEYGAFVRRAVAMRLNQLRLAPLQSDIDDICSEIFLKLLSGNCPLLLGLRNAQCINAWLMTVARNHTLDYVRKWSSRTRAIEAIAAAEDATPYASRPETPSSGASDNERREYIANQIRLLNATDRLLLDLFFVQGLKYYEIAQLLEMNINTVSARLRRAKLRLRKMLDEEELAS
jgi:RNA polymerase sigma-70 factor (ECF subfamily)